MKEAVSSTLLKTIKELQALKSLHNFALVGGTNLAMRYNHRESIDIDLFCPEIIGYKGFEKIQEEVQNFYRNNVFNFIDPTNINDQYTFLRFFVKKKILLLRLMLFKT